MDGKLIQVRVTGEEWARMQSAARAKSFRAISEFVRVTMLEECDRILDVVAS